MKKSILKLFALLFVTILLSLDFGASLMALVIEKITRKAFPTIVWKVRRYLNVTRLQTRKNAQIGEVIILPVEQIKLLKSWVMHFNSPNFF